ncbi:hypothetical protein LXL04_029927 [Taraxacum kok-saghyz]
MVLTIWELRKGLKNPDLDKAYGNDSNATDNYFTLKLHYGGVFTKVPGRKYKNGNVAYFDFVDIDIFSVHDINEMVRYIGYLTKTPLFYQYCKPNICLDYGLMPLGRVNIGYLTKTPLFYQYCHSGNGKKIATKGEQTGDGGRNAGGDGLKSGGSVGGKDEEENVLEPDNVLV